MGKLYIYNQQCGGVAGSTVSADLIEQYGGDPDDCADWTGYGIDELSLEALRLEALNETHGFSHYRAKVARALREAAKLG